MRKDRGKVWLGVGCIVINSKGQWLVVKKKYSGLKGVWSMPAGFVKEGEDVIAACKRETKEETGIDCKVLGLAALRSGVIRHEISDNMAIFYCQPIHNEQPIQIQEDELEDVRWLSVKELIESNESSVLIKELASSFHPNNYLPIYEAKDPGAIFQYTTYNLLFKKGE